MYLGIDLGGTNIAVGLVDEKGAILAKDSTPTLSQRPYQEVVKDMADLCAKVAASDGYSMDQIKGIGIGSPGTVDAENGVIVYANNLDWHNVPLRAELQKYFSVPVQIENDANAAAFGAYVMEGGQVDSFLMITLGTGIGGGIIIDKKIYRGFNGAGGELGHITLVHDGVPCTCGRRGCWESYASVTALIRQTTEAIEAHPDSLMKQLADEKGEVSGRTAFEAAKKGDAAAQAVVDQYINYIADGVSSMINIFQPKLFLIGGGISKEGDYLLNPIKQYVLDNTYCKEIPQTEIKIAAHQNDAGIIGAAFASK